MTLQKCMTSAALTAIGSLVLWGMSADNSFAADPIEVYAELPQTSSVRVSPSGRYVVMLKPYKGYVGAFLYDLQNPKGGPTVLPAPEGALLKTVFWGNDSNIITRAQFREEGGRGKMRKFGTEYSRYISTNIVTGKSHVLLEDLVFQDSDVAGSRKKVKTSTARGGEVVHTLPDDPQHVLMSWYEFDGKPELKHYKVNLDTGDITLIRGLPIRTNQTEMTVDGSDVAAYTKYDPDDGKFEVFVGDRLSNKPIWSRDFNKDENPTVSMIAILSDTGKILMTESEKETLTLFTIDPASGATAPYRFDFSLPDVEEVGPIFDRFTGQLIGVGYTDDHYKVSYTAEPYKSWHKMLEQTFPGKRISISSRTRDNAAVTVFISDNDSAGQYYIYRPDKAEIGSLGKRYPDIKANEIGKTVRMDYTARDGLKIPAYLTLPPGKSVQSGAMSLVVMPHGGPIARDDAEFDWWAQYLASKGYAVFKPQFRGSTGFGYNFTKKGYGEFGVGMVTDTIDGVKHLIEKGVANPDKICVTGASYGGYQALALPVAEPDMFKCALSLNGVSDIPAILKYEVARGGGADSGLMKFWNRIIGNYYTDRDKMKEQSPAENVSAIKAEVVIMHGEDDMTVPYEQSEIMAKAMKKQGQSGKVIVLKNDDHFLSLPESRLKLLKESDKLFSKHLD